jgi:hypothetical protein
MTWRSDISGNDRFFGCLPYLIPLIEIVQPLMLLAVLVPALAPLSFLLAPLLPLLKIYYGIPFGSFAVFLLLFLAVVQNPKINYSVRFNTLQSLLISILISLWGLVSNYALQPLLGGTVATISLLVLAVAVFAVCLYSIGMTAFGKYADVPKLSENVRLMIH